MLNVILGIDPGWVNLGWVLSVYDEEDNILMVYSGTYNTRIDHKSSDPVSYVIGLSNFFLKKILPKIQSQEREWRAIALAIEQQPKKKKQFTKHELLQQMIEAVSYTYFAKQDSINGKDFLVHRYSAVSTKKVFGVWRKGATYEERKSEIFDKVNSLAALDPNQSEEFNKYPLIVPVGTHHEADALACLNVYINKSHNHDKFNVGIYRKTKVLKRKLTRKQKATSLDDTTEGSAPKKSRTNSSSSKQKKTTSNTRGHTTPRSENKDL